MYSFYHSGDIGDLIYGLAPINRLGGGDLYVGERSFVSIAQPRVGITPEVFTFVKDFVAQQPYIRQFKRVTFEPFVTFNLDMARRYADGLYRDALGDDPHILQIYLHVCNLPINDFSPWLSAGQTYVADVIFARSMRVRSPLFDWKRAVEKYNKKAVFIGTDEEYADFCSRFGTVRRMKSTSLAAFAYAINASSLVVTNSSCFLAVALGLGKRVIQETLPKYPHALKNYTTSRTPNCTDFYENPVFPDV